MGSFDKTKGQDKAAFQQLGDDHGEGGQRDIDADSSDDVPTEDFVGMAKTGEQNFAKDGQGAPDESNRSD
jgi:hypothetical protein